MEKVVKQYEMLVSNAGEITQTMLDGDSGKYVLTVLSELLRDLLEVGNVSGAILVIRKLYEAAGIPFEKMETCVADAVAWVALLICIYRRPRATCTEKLSHLAGVESQL